jgi:hypothetical protein
MQDPERIKRFTRGVAIMRDPPWIPIAVWMSVVPMLAQFGVIAAPWELYSFPVAALATALASHWFKRTYGIVTPSPGALRGTGSGCLNVGVAAVVFLGLQLLTVATRLPVELGVLAFGAWLAWGARASKGLRPHLYLLAAIVVGLAFLPLINNLTARGSLQYYGAIFMSAFGVGWLYVCLQDFRAIRRSLRDAQG